MAQKPEESREYDFSDAHLKQFADSTCDNVERDIAHFITRNVDNTTIADLRISISNFSDAPDDHQSFGEVGIAVEQKNNAAENVRVAIRTIRTAASNVFKKENTYYKIYGFGGLDKLPDEKLFRLGRRVSNVTLSQLQVLASEGITNETVIALNALIHIFDAAIDNVQNATNQREIHKQERIEKGNIVYREVLRLCNIGKDIFASIDEARYNDYVIYDTPASNEG